MLHKLHNKHWQAGILPQAGASIAYGRMRYSGAWVDLLRPTDEANYDNSSKASSFIMLPWANRIRDGLLHANGETHQLKTTKDDGTARHGDVRKRPWQIQERSETAISLTFNSADFDDINFPFAFSAKARFHLDEVDFIWQLTLTNEDEQAMPGGFGFHPYFVHPAANMPLLQVPAAQQFELRNAMADAPPVAIQQAVDFRQPRPVSADMQLDDLLTQRNTDAPIRLIYEDWNVELLMQADAIFKHVLVFTAPDGTLAVEPQTNANDGFALHAKGIEEAGIFVLQPGESASGTVKLSLNFHVE